MKRNIHIHLHDGGWDESKHPRKGDGKFGQGSGGGKKEPVSKADHIVHAKHEGARQLAVAREAGVAKFSKQDLSDLADAAESEYKRLRDEYPKPAAAIQAAHKKVLAGEKLTGTDAVVLREALQSRARKMDTDEDAKRYKDLARRFDQSLLSVK